MFPLKTGFQNFMFYWTALCASYDITVGSWIGVGIQSAIGLYFIVIGTKKDVHNGETKRD